MVYLVKPDQDPRDISIIDGKNDVDVVQTLNLQAKLRKLPGWRKPADDDTSGCVAETSSAKLFRAR